MSLKHFPNTVSVEDVIEALRTDGYAIVDDLASAEKMYGVIAEMSRGSLIFDH